MSQQDVYKLLKQVREKLSSQDIQDRIKDIQRCNLQRNLKRLVESRMVKMESVNNYGRRVYWVEEKEDG